MTGRELSENLNYLGMSSGIRKLALKEKLATAENEEIGLVRKDKMGEYNKLVTIISR